MRLLVEAKCSTNIRYRREAKFLLISNCEH